MNNATTTYHFKATMINLHTRDEVCIDIETDSDSFVAVFKAIRRTHSSFDWGIFETWEIGQTVAVEAIAA